jgi:hypothetical protein
MMNKSIAIFIILLSACSKTINQDTLKRAEKHCSDKGGTYSIYIADTNEKFANCKDGSRKQITHNK